MLRLPLKFACVLYIIFISSVWSASFSDFCSEDLSCHIPLICSNTSQCICSISSSFWNSKQNTCLSCPPGWIEWQNDKCLLFIEPSGSGISYQKARNACSTHDAQILHIGNHEDFVQLEYKTNDLLEGRYTDAVAEFLHNGVWINLTNNEFKQAHLNIKTQLNVNTDWCEMEYENSTSSWNGCVHVTKRFSKDENDTSLCLSYVQCNEKLSYICEKSAQILDDGDNVKYQDRIFNIVSDLIGNVLFPSGESNNGVVSCNQHINYEYNLAKPQPQPQPQPQIIYHTNAPLTQLQQPSAQASKSANTILYIVIAIGGVVLIFILLCCFCGGGFLIWKRNDTSKGPLGSSRFRRRRDRTSVDSTASDATN